MRVAINIKWDVDYDENGNLLPQEVKIPQNIKDEEIVDYLSNLTSFCFDGFEIVNIKGE